MFATRAETVSIGEVEGEAPQVPPTPQGKEDDVNTDQEDGKEVEQQQEEKEEEPPTEPEEEEPQDIMPNLLEGESFTEHGQLGTYLTCLISADRMQSV